jgi:hypothetical protein
MRTMRVPLVALAPPPRASLLFQHCVSCCPLDSKVLPGHERPLVSLTSLLISARYLRGHDANHTHTHASNSGGSSVSHPVNGSRLQQHSNTTSRQPLPTTARVVGGADIERLAVVVCRTAQCRQQGGFRPDRPQPPA